ncbi:hypothetical protein FWC63_00790 [Candidatus Saccharibacteria bacterium]|nr:hypothetical protein [Candidatus Saccharibacteria bacterium]
MTTRTKQRTTHTLRLTVAGVLAVLVVIGVAMASGLLTESAMGADGMAEVCAYNPGHPLCSVEAGGGEAAVNETAQNIMNMLIWFGAAVAVIFVVVGGIQIVSANGDQAKMVRGRNTLLFAIFGLIIALLATFMTEWVLDLFY